MPNWCYTHYTIYGPEKTIKKLDKAIKWASIMGLWNKPKFYRQIAVFDGEMLLIDKIGAHIGVFFKNVFRWVKEWCCYLKRLPSRIIKTVGWLTKRQNSYVGDAWLYFVLRCMGVKRSTILTKDGRSRGNCRGYICDCNVAYEGDHSFMDIWCDTAWSEADLFRHILVNDFNLEVDYTAAEGGCGYYCTNIPDLEEDWNVDFWAIDTDWEAGDYTFKEVLQMLHDIIGNAITEKNMWDEINAYNTKHKDDDARIYVNQYEYVCD